MFDKKEFIEIIKLMMGKELIGGYGGNISIRKMMLFNNSIWYE